MYYLITPLITVPVLLLLLLLLPTTYAAPHPLTQISRRAIHPRDSASGVSDYKGGTTSGSPLIHDCLQINENIAGDGTWHFPNMHHRTIATYGTCAFGVDKGANSINNDDVIRLIIDSVMLFTWEDKVGASGVASCTGQNKKELKWSIYHTE